jgi:DNA-binding NtrC family response regulator
MGSGRILIIEDRDSLRKLMSEALRQQSYDVEAAATGEDGINSVQSKSFDLVLTDLKLPGASGLDVLRASRAAQPATPVVVLTAYGNVATAVEAMKFGAADFLEKPVEIDDLYRLVSAWIGEDLEGAVFQPSGAPAIVGRHPQLRASLRLLRRVAPTSSTVLLTGESGTGKELFARSLHALSPRAKAPFVAVNCAAIPESLMENELFGHEKGAFTGADRRQAGRFEVAEGGTLLLDEIGELSLAVQAKVLRVLEERTFERVGGGPTVKADVRLVAATNRNLGRMVDDGSFRSDLYFRLDVFPIQLPALRDRPTDIPLLARHLLAAIATRHSLPTPELTPAAFEVLSNEPWPGNVRQLANVLERSVILNAGGRIDAAELRQLVQPLGGSDEKERLREALLEADGDKKRASELLGVSYRTLLRRIKDHDLEGFPRYRS